MTAETQPSLEPDLTGTTLDRYLLLRRLGVGGMGAVYEAEHVQLHKRFALKMLREELAQNELFRRRFLREARAASAVTHPHVVDISDFGEAADGRVFFVMELLEGKDLQDLLAAEGRLSWPRTQEILVQVASALEAAHRHGVIHRDIKPSNVFLEDVPDLGGEVFVKVLDFGIAKLSGKQGQPTLQLTSTQEIFGTVAYMAPEMAKGISDDRRSDIYSLGVMMYQMLVGEVPFTEGNAFQILSQHVESPPPRPRDKQPSIPEGVEAIILKALAKDPNARFSSMQEFGRALRYGSLDVPKTPAGLQTTMLHMAPISRYPSGGVGAALDKTESLPSSSVHATPSSERVEPTVVEPTVVSQPVVEVSSEAEPVVSEPVVSEPVVSEPVVSELVVSGSSDAMAVVVPEARKRLWPWLVLSILGVGVGIGAVANFVGRDADDESAVIVMQAEPEPEPEPLAITPPASTPEPAAVPSVAVAPEPVDELVEPVPVEPDPVEPELVAPTPEPDPVAPAVHPKHKGTSQPPKPRSDAKVVAALKSKILAKCKGSGDTTVRIEGLIASSGMIASPLITPSTGPGACVKKIVMAAKFDAAGGVRPLPRFSVAL